MEEKDEIPDFTGITVVWQQMGDVALPQQDLSQTQRKRLQEIWGGIVERGGGTFAYLDEDEAVATIQPIADYLLEHEQITVLLAGTTAGDEDSDYTMTLSQKRADAVRSTLVQLGVDESRIVTMGLGSSDPWHVYGAGYEGSIASGNRKVVLLDASSDTAKEILSE